MAGGGGGRARGSLGEATVARRISVGEPVAPASVSAAALASTPPAAMTRWTGVLLHWAHERAGASYAAAMAPIGLKPQQVGILQWLGARGPTPQARLGEHLQVDKVSMVGFLNALEAAGLVARVPHPTDRRAFDVRLTALGRRRLAAAEAVTARIEREFFAPLAPSEIAALRDMLARLAGLAPAGGGDG